MLNNASRRLGGANLAYRPKKKIEEERIRNKEYDIWPRVFAHPCQTSK